jgi:(3,5-dihydroxyphenyl)acetyl-CoA 1,2-dioxygenase
MTKDVGSSSLPPCLRHAPDLGPSPEMGVSALENHIADSERLLRELPAKIERTTEQERLAAEIHRSCRAARARFLSLHGAWLYHRLTEGFTARLDLSELAFKAAELCPGLLPTRLEIAEERRKTQAQKEGREIDQGLFFHALLSLPECGRHIEETARRPSHRAVERLEEFMALGRLILATVSIERRGVAAHVTINNQTCLNAEDDALVEDMETAVDLVLLAPEIRVGVLRGGVMDHPRYAGRRVFCAGINLKALQRGKISFVDFLLRRELGYISKILRGLSSGAATGGDAARTIEKPWIAVVDGFAIGGGAQQLLAFDHVVAATDSYIRLPAAKEGIVPGFANLRLTRAVGSRLARQLIIGDRKLQPSEADFRLLVDQVVDTPDIEAAVDRQVLALSAPAVIPNRRMLHLAEEPIDLFVGYAAEFASLQAERLYSDDLFANLREFSEGR